MEIAHMAIVRLRDFYTEGQYTVSIKHNLLNRILRCDLARLVPRSQKNPRSWVR